MSSVLHMEEGADIQLLSQPHKSRHSSRRSSESSNPDFLFITIIARIILSLVKRFWALTGVALFSLFLFYSLYGGLCAFFLVCFGITGVLYQAGDKLLFHPEQPPHSRVFVPSPALFNLPFESLFIKARDGTQLHMFLVKQEEKLYGQVPTLLFLHGNAGNIGHRLMNVKGLHAGVGCNVALVEYRGYGRSDGSPSEEGMYMDAQAGLDYLHSRQDLARDKIIVFGRSLGGAVAVDLASRAQNKERLAAILLENTFTSIPEVARLIFPFSFVKYIPVWFYKNQFKSKRKICRLSQPTLFLSGLEDKLIPAKMMTDLYTTCGAPLKKLARFPKGTHNETWTSPDYYQTINYFLDEAVYLSREPDRQRMDSPASLVHPNHVHNV